MNVFKGVMGALSIGVWTTTAAFAAEETLPAFAYDMVSEVTFATTANSKCDGVEMRPARLQKYILAMYAQLAKAGVSAEAAAKHFETETAQAQIAARDAALRAKHGIQADGIPGLCAAVRAEAKVNRPFAKLLRIR